MWRSAIAAVLGELWQFVWDCVVGRTVVAPVRALPVPAVVPLRPTAAPAHRAPVPSGAIVSAGAVTLYVCVPVATVWLRPVLAYDAVVATVPYGTAVSATEARNDFWAISVAGQGVGWVRVSELTERRADIYPALHPNLQYEAWSQETRAIRLLLADAYAGGALGLPLQPEEFAAYSLMAWQRRLPEVSRRPRMAGQWHELYKGLRSVYVSLEPRTGAVCESTDPTLPVVLGYVAAVQVDTTIELHRVSTAGVYTHERLSPDVWRTMKPVFIVVR